MNRHTIFLLALLLITPSSALADQDTIPVTTLGPGETLDLFFQNTVLPDPSVKVLQFTGMAQAFGTPGTAAILGMHFDYLESDGSTVIVPSPNFYQSAIQPGIGLVPINAGPVTLPFCPEDVSIHFQNLSENVEIELSGIFDHTCVPVPEPSTAILGSLVTLGWGLIRRGQRIC